MTVNEFWDLVDTIDLDDREDGKYTEEEIYRIACAFISLTTKEKREIGGWVKMVDLLQPLDKNGNLKKPETFKQWVKDVRYAKGEVTPNNKMLSGKNIDSITFDEFKEKTEELQRDLYKQQVKTWDTMNSYRRILRDEARIERMKELIQEAISKIPELPKVNYQKGEADCKNEAVMLISDMHIGMQIDNFANKYNNEIAKKRLMAYVDETIKLCKDNHVKRLNVSNLNDCIHGLIHVTARIEEEEDVIGQVIIASEYLAEALIKLQEAAPEVIYRSVTDNHSRTNANYKDHIEKESFCRIIDFYLEERLKGTNIIFANDNLDVDISKFELLNGKLMICVHGHRDNINVALQSFVGATHRYVDYVCMGHYHESKMKSYQGAKVFVNGSICGADSYATSKRLFGDPEQTLLIFSGDTLSVNYVNLRNIK